MPTYRVRQGRTFGAFDQHTAGALVELQEHEAVPFFDKLELAEGGNGPSAPEPAKEEAVSLDTVSSEDGQTDADEVKTAKRKAAKE